jgi:hypothetical protein
MWTCGGVPGGFTQGLRPGLTDAAALRLEFGLQRLKACLMSPHLRYDWQIPRFLAGC